MPIRFCMVIVFAATVATPLTAATRATPATLAAVLAGARGGGTIHLAPGDYTAIELRSRQWTPPLTIEADEAHITSVQLRAVSGLTWRGGRFDGGDTVRSGFNVAGGDHIIIDGTAMAHYLRNGIGLGSVSDARVINNHFTDMGSDGIDIGLSRRVVVDHNDCRSTHPTPGAHPDCVQLWSRPSEPPTADIAITNNQAEGDTQGFTAFNHVRDGVDDGGFDRITVENNVARVGSYHGVTVMDCRHCSVRNNRVETQPDPLNPKIRAWIKVVRGSDTVACGNVAKDFPGADGSERCRADPVSR